MQSTRTVPQTKENKVSSQIKAEPANCDFTAQQLQLGNISQIIKHFWDLGLYFCMKLALNTSCIQAAPNSIKQFPLEKYNCAFFPSWNQALIETYKSCQQLFVFRLYSSSEKIAIKKKLLAE